MSDTNAREPLPDTEDPGERFRDDLRGDDAAGAPDSGKAVLDADTIGSALRDGDTA